MAVFGLSALAFLAAGQTLVAISFAVVAVLSLLCSSRVLRTLSHMCSDAGLVVGPLGFEPRTDGLKVSGSSFKTAGKTQETARTCYASKDQ